MSHSTTAQAPIAQAGPFHETITEERVAQFAEATGFGDALRSRIGVPPTFITRYRVGEFELFEKLGISLSSILHAEQSYEYRFAIQVGDSITYTTRVAGVVDKSAGGRKMQFLTLESEFLASREGRDLGVAAVARTVVVVRGPAPEAA